VTTVRGNVGGVRRRLSIVVRNQCNCAPPWPCMTALGPGRVKTFFLPQKLQAAGRDPRRSQGKMMSEQVEPPPQEGEDATPPALITDFNREPCWSGTSRGARNSSCGAQSPYRLAGIPARKLRCSRARRWDPDCHGDKRRVPTRIVGRLAGVSSAVGYGAALTPRWRQAATAAPSASPAARFAPSFRLRAVENCLQKQPILPPC
jgi:hypothetical protein